MLRYSLLTIWLAFLALIAAPNAYATDPFTPAPTPAESFDVGMLHVDKFVQAINRSCSFRASLPAPGPGTTPSRSFLPSTPFTRLRFPVSMADPLPKKNCSSLPLCAISGKFSTWHKIEKPIIIGHSLGGTLGIALAEEHPQRLAGVVSIDGMPVFPMVANLDAKQRETMAAQMAGMFTTLSKDDEFAAQKNFMSTVGTNKPDLVEPAAKLESRSDPKAIAAWLQEDLTTDLRQDLSKITIPLLAFMPFDPDSAKSPLAPSQDQLLAFYKDLLKGAPQATVVPISPARHFAMLDQPEEFDKAVTKFLSSTWQ